MERITWKRLADDWPVIFCLVVAGWFAVSAMNVGDRMRDVVPERPHAAQPAAEPSAVSVSQNLDLKVQSFYLENSDSGLDAKVTLELINQSGNELAFRSTNLSLVRSDGTTYDAAAARPASVQVGPLMTVLTTVSFTVDARAGGTWTIKYGDRNVYRGLPR